MNEIIEGKLNSYCEFVRCGKLTAAMALQNRYVKEAQNIIINQYDLMLYIKDLSEGWKTIWIYKDEYMLEVIKNLPEQPKTVYEHWILGKVFGYSDESIREFIEAKVFYK